MTAKVILNPYAGRWLALKRKAEIISALEEAGVDFELVSTEKPGDGSKLSAIAVEAGFNPIIAAGGDGSISEVVNGIMQALTSGEEVSPVFLGVMPLGSANDFVDNLHLPKDLGEAAKVISTGKYRTIDLGHVITRGNGQERYFDNNAAIGLEPFITLIQQRITRIHGTIRYLLATLIGILNNPRWSMHLTWQGGEYHGPVTLVTVGNCPRTGGLFYMTPHADPYDRKLTFVYGFMSTRLQILKLLPRTMRSSSGSYVEHPDIHEIHSDWLKVTLDNPTPAHADGEIIAASISEIEYRVIPDKLHVLLP